jgi:hypothetical protein
MRTFSDWLVVAIVLGLAACYVLRPPVPPVLVQGVMDEAPRPGWPSLIIPLAAPEPEAPVSLPHESWCEPIEPRICKTSADCPTAPDGTPMTCSPQWYAPALASSAVPRNVCAVGYPTRAVREWREQRLRVLVHELCDVADDCDPEQLHDYLAVLILRESTWRPYKVHRLGADVRANARAWEKYAGLYLGNPAASEPGRWSAGRGYFGANAAALLHVWDPLAIPEALCGEVESVIVHLRTARKRWHLLNGGVTCGANQAHRGTARDGGPSWYDVSLANSGSEACPAKEGRPLAVREGFVKRAKSRKLDAYSGVTLAMLGRDVSRDEQTTFAARVRRKMGAVELPR